MSRRNHAPLCVLILAELALLACTAPPQTAQDIATAANVAAYTAQLNACLQSHTLYDAQVCGANVRASWCGYGKPLADVEACGDGGVPLDAQTGMPLPSSVSTALSVFVGPRLDAGAPADAGGQ